VVAGSEARSYPRRIELFLFSTPVSHIRPARTVSISIAAPAADVYAFVADPRNLPQWASGLGSTPTPLPDGTWRVETPTGPMRVAFAPKNKFGIVDHVVTPLTGGGPAVDVPLRVIANGNGSEVMLTLFQQPGMSDAQHAADAELVQADLARLKQALER
jgi:carbon monoxide dehydrogenase subunit G